MIMQIRRGSYIRIGVIYKNNSNCAIGKTEIIRFFSQMLYYVLMFSTITDGRFEK